MQLFEKWIARKGQWCTSNDIVESLLLTQGTGRHVSKLNLPQYQQLKEFLIGVGGDWIHIALYIGFDKSELLLDEDTTDVMSTQLDMFLEIWSMPDCGQKTIVILQKLKNVVLVVPYSGIIFKHYIVCITCMIYIRAAIYNYKIKFKLIGITRHSVTN